MKITPAEAANALSKNEGNTFLELFRRENCSIEIYAPIGRDKQTPHLQDEVYVIISGTGMFQDGDEHYPFAPGDLIFIPAGREHRFTSFSEDFKTWVIFF